MNKLVTPELSDTLLNYLISNISLGDSAELETKDFPVPSEITPDALNSLIEDLASQGLIEIESSGYGDGIFVYNISINKRAIDFQRHGGFVGQEVLFKQNVEKLLLEIKNLKPSSTEQAEKITAIVGNIASFLGLVM